MLVIQLMSVLFADYLQESGTQQDVAPEPVDHKDKISKGKKEDTQDQTHTYLKPRGRRRVSYDRTSRWPCPACLVGAALSQVMLRSCGLILDDGFRGNGLTGLVFGRFNSCLHSF